MKQETVIASSTLILGTQGTKDEKRACHRPRQFKGGSIIIDWENSTIDCIIRDMSDAGARLRIASQLGVPNLFDLVALSANNEFKCEVVWRRGFEVGVKFVQEDQ